MSYLLWLSNVCPIKFDLLFERFLDPNRTEPPDIDIDFCRDGRQAVIDYTKENNTPIGRPIRIADKGAKPITELVNQPA